MFKRVTLLVMIFLSFITYESESARILGLFTSPSKSHVIIYQSLMLRLAELGHDVTVVSSFETTKNVPKTYRYINIPFSNNEIERTSDQFMKASEGEGRSLSQIFKMMNLMLSRQEEVLTHPKVQQLKDNEQFDLAIFGWFVNDYQIGIAAHFKCPSIMIVTASPTVFSRSYIGSPSGTSFNPSMFLHKRGSMNFKDRVMNLLFNSAEWVVDKLWNYFIYKPTYERLFPSNKYPSLEEAKLNISLVLFSSHFSSGSIEPALPALIEVGGMQIKDEPSPLPMDIKEWLDGAKHGAVFFSLGSNVKSSSLSLERREIILRVLSKLKQRVLWKFETDDLTDIPPNIMINKWFPQSDILAHPNTKLFISHCGRGSVAESRFHGIPILAIPVFADQFGNAKSVVEEGWGVQQLITDLTEESFTEKINEILNNSTYSEIVQQMSRLYRDRPERPMDKATYWVEYILRHNGAKHLQSPAVHLNIIQYHSIDVIAFLAICLYISLKLTKWVMCKLFKLYKSKLKFKKD